MSEAEYTTQEDRAVNYGGTKDSELVSLRKLNKAKVLKLEPNLSQEIGFGLFSPESGIINSHAFISSLENNIEDSENGELVYAIGEYLAGLILCITDGPLHSHSRNQCPGTHQRFSTGGKLDDWAN
ncbi:hypothetical protein PSTG_13902 [Puccinia striiformis f. sp. tritici PST-78]|uniref:Uncharacterized protein n=1 Tax=Puccinia striiformis f. sp. tritici PST-78 TaxID=1165861 RepID=A0A0L0V082_9BASI|nr:hypothetical protein PSTG_13902 [Puccinia striiformis f. sp. tritici PST-78]